MAARQGIRVAMEAGFNSLLVETDSMSLFEALRKKRKPASPFGLILKDIYSLMSQCNQISFSFVKRAGNEVAHLLAKRSLDLEEQRVWLEEAPEDVLPFVAMDIANQ
ncbi:uncharacterized protein LOC104899004 [Beta vulgaris subsp. vulgaris]|uniref:uncharacterized protein LOC104899004 n=1 Tax=Beta vulgaris subsp. vulgaris TaxID=3555 RepID=UPI00053F8ECE|nr:uncharacterized protein LOC104899004 [Beta vulgaris subsp. vulgaris]